MSTPPEPRSGDRLLFGPFELRPTERLLRRDGDSVAIGSRAMDILLRLLERPGEMVGRDALLAAGWGELNVEPAALRVQVSLLRKTLAAGDPNARYVTSVPGRGYCFVAPVRRQTDVAAAAVPADPKEPAALPGFRRMIGRETVAETLERTISAEPFVTLVGPGGIGKTTVALALAHRMLGAFDGDVAFVDLAIHRSDDAVAGAVSNALRLPRLGDGPVADVAAQLRPRRLLLVLDSCEHVVAGAATLAEAICQAAPRCHIVATSREPLNARGEQVYRLAALETPPPETLSYESVCGYPAAQLFVERAAAGGGRIEGSPEDAALIADICRKLDGIPLAIELAAGRVDAFGLATTRALLDGRLRLSWRGLRTAPPRQLTLSATLDWSYELLSSEEAALLRSLSRFAGPFTLDAAEAVADEALRTDVWRALAGLVSKSLVSVDGRGPRTQYRLLDTTREYAALKLESAGELARAAARHAAWTLADLTTEEARLNLGSMREWLDHFSYRIHDAEAALDWSLSEGGDPSFAPPLTLASRPIWMRFGGDLKRWRTRIRAALEVVEPKSRDEFALNVALSQTLYGGSPRDAEIVSGQAQELAAAGVDDVHAWLNVRLNLWNIHISVTPDVGRARDEARLYHEVAGLLGEPFEKVIAERILGVAELVAGNLPAARASTERALAMAPNLSDSARIASAWDPDVVSRNTLVSLLWLEGLPETAMATARGNLNLAEATGSALTRATVLADSCGGVALYIGDLEAAVRYAAMLDECVERGAGSGFGAWAQVLRATIAAQRGDAGPGRALLARELPAECGHPRCASVLTELAFRLGAAGAADIGRDLANSLLQRVEVTGERWIWSEVQRVRGELARAPSEAEALFEASLAVAQQQGARAWALRAATSLARRRPSAAGDLLRPMLASFDEGAATRDHVEARAVLAEYGLGLPRV